jgi:transposase InsO family protein
MKKSWFDQRADNGLEWAVVRVLVPEETLWGGNMVTWSPARVVYYPCRVNKIHRREVVGRNMTRKEAEALAKMLGSIETN